MGALSVNITHTSLYCASTFSVAVSLHDGIYSEPTNWPGLSEAHVRIQLCTGSTGRYVDLIEGYCDTAHLDIISGYARLDGRDFSSLFLDKKSPGTFQNQASGEIAAELARGHGLEARVTNTPSYAGNYDGQNHSVVNLVQFAKLACDWDILVALAQAENYDIFVSGRTLYFQPRDVDDYPLADIHVRDLIALHVNRRRSLGQDPSVIVQSWNARRGIAVLESVGVSNSEERGIRPLTSGIRMVRPNLRPDQASVLADRISTDLKRQGMSLEFTVPGDTALVPRQSVRIIGTRSDFDTIYRIEAVTYRYRASTGFTQMVRARPV